jgi:hypothetical protein
MAGQLFHYTMAEQSFYHGGPSSGFGVAASDTGLTFLRHQAALMTCHVRGSVKEGRHVMAYRFRPRSMLKLAIIGLVAVLGGCVAYPADPGYGAYPAYGSGYGYGAPYYSGAYVGIGGGGWHGGGWRH